MPRSSLLWRAYAPCLVIALLSAVALSWYVIHTFRDYIIVETKRELSLHAVLLAEELADDVDSRSAEEREDDVARVARQFGERVTLVDTRGHV
ncbi:MAG: hypothetical protein KDD44_07875, partial [Bdellovibrionales bacterium]|nr:hypothetical protein [Bdellovibrionales bacterium]